MIRALPIFIPIILLGLSFWKAGVHHKYNEVKRLETEAVAAQEKLDSLKALSVAYKHMTREFTRHSGLSSEDGNSLTKGDVSGQVGRFVDSLIQSLETKPHFSSGKTQLIFLSVTPGRRRPLPPFLSVDFELNFRGRFFALPGLLQLLSDTARESHCAISIGELSLNPIEAGRGSGELSIKLPLRVYFLEE